MALSFPLPDLAATEKLAAMLAPLLGRGDVLALQGELGTGKTTFARDLLRQLGVTGDVPSPTFTLVQTYDTAQFSVAHFDLYRLKSADELDELGFDDALANGVALIEWPERAARRLTGNVLTLHFHLEANGQRVCLLDGSGDWSRRLEKMSPPPRGEGI